MQTPSQELLTFNTKYPPIYTDWKEGKKQTVSSEPYLLAISEKPFCYVTKRQRRRVDKAPCDCYTSSLSLVCYCHVHGPSGQTDLKQEIKYCTLANDVTEMAIGSGSDDV